MVMVKSIILLTNILSPYRRFLFDKLYTSFENNGIKLTVLVMSYKEPNRSWTYDDYKTSYTRLLKGKQVTVKEGIYLTFNWNLKQVYREINPDIIISSGSYIAPAVWQTALLSAEFGFKLLFWSESHLGESRNYSKGLINIRDSIRKSIYTKHSGFIYTGKLSRQFIEKYAKANSQYFFLPNLIDNEKFDATNSYSDIQCLMIRKKYNLSASDKVLLIPARLIPLKGIIEFFSLLAKVQNKNDLVVLIAGEGELRKNIKDAADNYGIDVRMPGNQTEEQMLELYAISDICALTSLSDANPLVLIEASWCSLPLIVSEHCGNYPELVRDGENGCVFSYKEEGEAIRKISHWINESIEGLHEAGKISHNIAEKTFDSDIATKRFVNTLIETY
jgi:glycosyltransferase involved in cell wall biosynthesis